MNVAQQVRAAKQKHPDDFCPVKGCLWRVYTSRGVSPCQNHPSEAERNAVSCGGSPSNGASEPDKGRARSTVRSPREAYYDHKRRMPF